MYSTGSVLFVNAPQMLFCVTYMWFYNHVCADLYLSNFEDWVDPQSITDVIYVVHAEIGEAQRGNETPAADWCLFLLC